MMKCSKIKITVYIPSHNYGRFLRDAIESVLRQTIDDWELLIIDDNSSDETADIIKCYKNDKRIRIFKTKGLGLLGVCNFALKKAQGEYIIRLDADDIFDENILLVLMNYMEKNPDCALVFPDYYLIDEYNEIFGHEIRQKIFEDNHMLDMPPNGACTLIRKQILKECGGYDNNLNAQDGFDLWRKTIKKYKCSNINLPLFYYRRHRGNSTNNISRILQAQNAIKIETVKPLLKKYGPYIAVIPCRKNYDFRKDVWNEKINGETLLERSINILSESKYIDHIIVACDNEEVLDTLKQYKNKRLKFFLREEKDTIRTKSLIPALEKIVKKIDPEYKGITTLVYVQNPFITKEAVDESIFTLIMNEADTAMGVEEIKFPLYRRSSFGLEAVNKNLNFSTDYDAIYKEASTSIAFLNKNLKVGSIKGTKIVNFIVNSDNIYFIDSELKLKIARILEKQK